MNFISCLADDIPLQVHVLFQYLLKDTPIH